MRFIEDVFPLLVIVQSSPDEDAEFRELTTGFERYFRRGERYALLSTKQPGAPAMTPKLRKRMAAWAGEPRIHKYSKQLCVGAATLVDDALSRGALTALLWFWTPPSPLKAVASNEEGLEYCLHRLREENVPLPRPPAEIRAHLLAAIRNSETKAAAGAAP